MNDLSTICKTNGTTQEEAREAAKPFYYKLKTKPEAAAIGPVPEPDEAQTSK